MPWMTSTKDKEWGKKVGIPVHSPLKQGNNLGRCEVNFRNKMKGSDEYLNHFDVNPHLPSLSHSFSGI